MTNPTYPRDVMDMLCQGGALVVAISGGKDSDAMLTRLAEDRRTFGWTGRFIAIHHDVGRMEWAESLEHCRVMAHRFGAEFIVTSRPQGDLVHEIIQRYHKRPDAPPWPSSAARYCTADHKTSQADKWIRRNLDGNVVVALGIRAEESAARAKKPIFSERPNASAPSKGRRAVTWLPIFRYTVADVWQTLGLTLDQLREYQDFYQAAKADGFPWLMLNLETAFPAHPTYLRGNERVSCALCVLANHNDLTNGAEYNPALYRRLVWIEIITGYSFQPHRWLASIRPELLSPQQLQAIQDRGLPCLD